MNSASSINTYIGYLEKLATSRPNATKYILDIRRKPGLDTEPLRQALQDYIDNVWRVRANNAEKTFKLRITDFDIIP